MEGARYWLDSLGGACGRGRTGNLKTGAAGEEKDLAGEEREEEGY